jgi:hypothetical protein
MDVSSCSGIWPIKFRINSETIRVEFMPKTNLNGYNCPQWSIPSVPTQNVKRTLSDE